MIAQYANSTKKENNSLTIRSKIIFTMITFLLSLLIIFIIGEILIRIFNPLAYMYPRWKFSAKYGSMLYENCKMIEAIPGKWKFIYTINEYSYRGKPIPIKNKYGRENVVVLGDSYTFGAGVNDDEVYTAVMSKYLGEHFNVINLGVGGWGLTQQIRRYYEFGQLYLPKIVVLMFCGNDPKDNLKNKVTIIDNGRFKFHDSKNTINWIKKHLSYSIIQKSQLYNYFRRKLYEYFERGIINNEIVKVKTKSIIKNEIPYMEKFYNELLELFVEDLNKKGIKIIMISVNDQLNKFENIKNKVNELDSQGTINYIEITHWFENVSSNLRSPQGHYGKNWHYIIGRNLSEIILEKNLETM